MSSKEIGLKLQISYKATTDTTTLVNLTNHSYFNLHGLSASDESGSLLSVLDHELYLNSREYTPLDKDLIPTGTFAPVKDTPMDFQNPKRLDTDIESDFEQIVLAGKGYDCCWILEKSEALSLAASAYDPSSGRFLEVFTTCPAVQVYTGNFLDGTSGKKGKKMTKWTGLCLETQFPSDAPNHPDFPSILLRPSEEYDSTTVFKFSKREGK
jgi:aldose 1-epimerase